MELQFSHKIEFDNNEEIEIDFDVSFINSGFDYPGYGGGFKEEVELDLITFDDFKLTKEQTEHIEKLIENNDLDEAAWDAYNNQ